MRNFHQILGQNSDGIQRKEPLCPYSFRSRGYSSFKGEGPKVLKSHLQCGRHSLSSARPAFCRALWEGAPQPVACQDHSMAGILMGVRLDRQAATSSDTSPVTLGDGRPTACVVYACSGAMGPLPPHPGTLRGRGAERSTQQRSGKEKTGLSGVETLPADIGVM